MIRTFHTPGQKEFLHFHSQARTDLGGISHDAVQSEKTTESQFLLPPGAHSFHHTQRMTDPLLTAHQHRQISVPIEEQLP